MFVSHLTALFFLDCNIFEQSYKDSFYKYTFPSTCPSAYLRDGRTVRAVRKNRIKIMWKFSRKVIVILLCYFHFFHCLQQGLKWYFSHKYLKGLLSESICLVLCFTLVSTSITILLSKMWQENKLKFFSVHSIFSLLFAVLREESYQKQLPWTWSGVKQTPLFCCWGAEGGRGSWSWGTRGRDKKVSR